MKRVFLLKLSALFICLFCSISSAAQSDVFVQYRLAGKQVFSNDSVRTWSVVQELIDEETGISTLNENFARVTGVKAEFDFSKVDAKETIYHVTAKGEGMDQRYEVHVFDPDKISSVWYKSGSNPPVRTFIFVPRSVSTKTKFIVVMHGMTRTALKYIESWEQWSAKNDYIVIAPLFDAKDWKGSGKYNNGNIFTPDGKRVKRKKWTFQIVDDLHSGIAKGFRLKAEYYDLFGHSAGGQFVHRFMLFMPKAKVRLALAANPGWYTLPDLEQNFPYGLKHENLSFTNADLNSWTNRNVMILRGTEDVLRTGNLQTSAEADAQGQNRYERAGFMYDRIKAVNPATNWRLIDVPKVGHDQVKMALAAQYVLEMLNPKE